MSDQRKASYAAALIAFNGATAPPDFRAFGLNSEEAWQVKLAVKAGKGAELCSELPGDTLRPRICAHGSLAKKCEHCYDVREAYEEGFAEALYGVTQHSERAWESSNAKARCEK